MIDVQDTRLSVSARLSDMNTRRRRERRQAYTALESMVYGAAVLAMAGVMLFVWAGGA